MDENAFAPPVDAQRADALQRLAGGVELISQESGVAELIRGGFNRSTTSVDDEMERINRERPTLGAPTPGRDDTTTPLDEVEPGRGSGLTES